MATLTGQQIDSSYQGLLKTLDNAAITGTNRVISDGVGNALPLEVSTTTIKFTGNADFTAATVTGIGGGSAGLEVGTGTNSLQNAVGSASTASGAQSIALGSGALASGSQSMAYGDQAQATSTSAASFGQYAEATSTYAIAFGRTSTATADGAVAFGQQTSAAQAGAVAMGRQVTSDTADTTHVRALKIVAPDGGTGGNGITMLSPDGTSGVITLTNSSELAVDGTPIGGGGGGSAGLVSGTGTDSIVSAAALTTTAALAPEDYSIAIGDNANIEGTASNNAGVAIGKDVKTIYTGGVSIGKNIQQSTPSFNASQAISVGVDLRTEGSNSINYGHSNNVLGGSGGNRGAFGQSCSVSGSVSGNFAIGFQVTADRANTVSVKELETTVNGGGIILNSPNGTAYRVTVSDAGVLAVSAA